MEIGFGSPTSDFALGLAWVADRAVPTDASSQIKLLENWYVLFPKLPPPPIAVLTPAHAPSEPHLLCEPLSVAARMADKHGCELESSNPFSYSNRKPAVTKRDFAENPTLVKAIPHLQMRSNYLVGE